MKGAKAVYRSIKLTDDTNTMSLGVADQLRIMFSRLSNDEVAELYAEEKANEDYLKKCAALSMFIDKAVRRMTELKKSSVTVSITTELLPCLNEVINTDTGKGQHYDFEIFKNDTPVEYTKSIIVRIRPKGG